MDKENNKDLLAIFFDLDNTLIPTRIADTAASNKVIQNVRFNLFNLNVQMC